MVSGFLWVAMDAITLKATLRLGIQLGLTLPFRGRTASALCSRIIRYVTSLRQGVLQAGRSMTGRHDCVALSFAGDIRLGATRLLAYSLQPFVLHIFYFQGLIFILKQFVTRSKVRELGPAVRKPGNNVSPLGNGVRFSGPLNEVFGRANGRLAQVIHR